MSPIDSARRSTTSVRSTEDRAGYRAGCPQTGRRSPTERAGRPRLPEELTFARTVTVTASWLAGVPLTHPRNFALSAQLRGEREGARRVSDREGASSSHFISAAPGGAAVIAAARLFDTVAQIAA